MNARHNSPPSASGKVWFGGRWMSPETRAMYLEYKAACAEIGDYRRAGYEHPDVAEARDVRNLMATLETIAAVDRKQAAETSQPTAEGPAPFDQRGLALACLAGAVAAWCAVQWLF